MSDEDHFSSINQPGLTTGKVILSDLNEADTAPQPPTTRTSFSRSRVVDRISDLVVFMRTAEAGNYSEAARLLSLSPSAVSKLVSRLEDRIGARLFNRTSRALSLTCDGKIFYEKAFRVVTALEDAESMVPSSSEQVSGTLRIHSPPAFAMHQLAAFMPEFVAAYPDVQVELVLDDDPVDLIAGNIDVSIHVGPLNDSSFIARKVGTARFVCCASPDFLQRQGGTRENGCDALLNLAVGRRGVAMPRGQGRQAMRGKVASVATSDAQLLHRLVSMGLGVARLPDFVVRDDLANGTLVQVSETEAWEEDQPISVVYQARKNLPARTRAFIDFLGRKLKERPAEPVPSVPQLDPANPSGETAPTLSLLYVAHLVSATGFSDQRRAVGLDVPQSRLLIALAEYGELTVDGLADSLMLQRDIVDDIVAGLSGRGLVARSSSGTVLLTSPGKDLQASVQTQWRGYEEDQLSRFSVTDVAVVRRFLATYIRRFGPRWREH